MLDRKEKTLTGKIIAILIAAVMAAAVVCTAGALKASAAAKGPEGTATVTADEATVYETKSTDSKAVEKLNKGKTISIDREEYTSATDHSAANCWYYSSKEKGYVQSEQVDVKFGSADGTIKSPVNFRKGAGTVFEDYGTIPGGTTVKVLCQTLVQDTAVWYKVDYKGNTGYVWDTYLTLSDTKDSADTKSDNKADTTTKDTTSDKTTDTNTKSDDKADTTTKDTTSEKTADTNTKSDDKADTTTKNATSDKTADTKSDDKADTATKDKTSDKTTDTKSEDKADTTTKDKTSDKTTDTNTKSDDKADTATKDKASDKTTDTNSKSDNKADTTTKDKAADKTTDTNSKSDDKTDTATKDTTADKTTDTKSDNKTDTSALKKGIVLATGMVTAKKAIVRKEASTASDQISVLSQGADATLLTECFTSASDTSRLSIWYYSNDKKGFINSSLLKIRYSTITGKTSALLNMRSGAGTGYSNVGQLQKGQSVDIVMTAYAVDGGKWYKIKNGNAYAYVSAQFVTSLGGAKTTKKTTTTTKKKTTSEDLSYITESGFPASYIIKLKALHKVHPDWTFTPVQTGLNWSDAVARMTASDSNNLIAGSRDLSFRSAAKGNYDYLTNKYKSKDGKVFFTASEGAVKYYMDPRNWLTSKGVFMFENETYQDYQDLTAVRGVLYGNKTLYKKENAQYFIDAGKKYNLNAVYLASKAYNELGTSSRLVSGKFKGYEGYYNAFNIGAYDSAAGKASVNAMKYARENKWNTLETAVNGGAAYIQSEYVSKKQDNLYLEHFNVRNGLDKVGTNIFMTSVSAPYENAATIYKNYSENDLLGKTINFRIPVYKNMPAKSAAKPKGNNSDNNAYLKSLIVKAGSKKYKLITSDKLNYKKTFTVNVAKKVRTVNIRAAAASTRKAAGVSGGGKKKIAAGWNTFKVTCKASSGSKRVYTIKIYRKK